MGLLFAGLSILPVALLVFVLALVVARREPDPTGRGIYSVYVFLVIFVSLFVLAFAATAAVTSVVKLIQNQPQPSPFPMGGAMTGGDGLISGLPIGFPPFDARATYWRSLLGALPVAIAAAGVLWFHARRAQELLRAPGERSLATSRSYRYYLHATLFVAVLALLFSSATALDGLIRTIAPGLTAAGSRSAERGDGIEQLVSGAFLALLSFAIFRYHWRLREEDGRSQGTGEPPLAPLQPPPPA